MSGLAGVVVLYLRVGVPQFADTAGLGLLLALASATAPARDIYIDPSRSTGCPGRGDPAQRYRHADPCAAG